MKELANLQKERKEQDRKGAVVAQEKDKGECKKRGTKRTRGASV